MFKTEPAEVFPLSEASAHKRKDDFLNFEETRQFSVNDAEFVHFTSADEYVVISHRTTSVCDLVCISSVMLCCLTLSLMFLQC